MAPLSLMPPLSARDAESCSSGVQLDVALSSQHSKSLLSYRDETSLHGGPNIKYIA